MRHRMAGFKLGRDTEHRTALFRNLAAAVFTHGQITTTIPKAKAVKPFVEKLITLAKKGDLASRRRAVKLLQERVMVKGDDDEAVDRNKFGEIRKKKKSTPMLTKHLFDEIGPRYADRDGGYTRIIRLSRHRLGDGGQLCVLQLVGEEDGPQVSGQYSRRRDKANKRMEFAAKLRKAGKGDDEVAEDQTDEVAEDQTDEVAEEEVVEEEAAVEATDAPAEEQQAEEESAEKESE